MINVSKNQKTRTVLSILGATVILLTATSSHAIENKHAKAKKVEVAKEADLRIALDKVTVAANTGDLAGALEMINKLEAKYPNNPQVMEVATDLYAQMENRGMAFMMASQSAQTQDVVDRQRRILLSPKGAYVAAGYNNRHTTEAYENMVTLNGQIDLAPDMALSATFLNNYISTNEAFTRANGTTQSFYGFRQTGAVSLNKFFTDGQEVTGTVYGLGNNAGVGAKYSMWDATGVSSVSADYNRPESDYVQLAVQHGTNNNVMIERKQFFTPEITAHIDGKYTFYSMDHAENVAEAPGWDFNFDYVHPFDVFGSRDPNAIDGPITFGFHYDVNAEYFTHVAGARDTAGNLFHPLPVSTYEVHAFTASLGKTFWDGLKGEVTGGYGVNRIADNAGPIYGFLVNYSPIKHVDLELHANRTLLGGQNNGEKEQNIGADVKYSW